MAGSRPGRIMGLFWLYTGLRVLVFLVLFGALWLVGVRGLLGALLALVLGIPLSIYVLAGPRRKLAIALQDHVDARNDHQAQLRRRLNGEDPEGDDAGDGPDLDPLDAGSVDPGTLDSSTVRPSTFDPSTLDGSHEAIDLGKGPSSAASGSDERNGGDPRANRPDAGR